MEHLGVGRDLSHLQFYATAGQYSCNSGMDKTCFHTLRERKAEILDCKCAFVNTSKSLPCFSQYRT